MKILIKILVAIGVFLVILLILGTFQTYRMNNSSYQDQFTKGTLPAPFPNGFYAGSTDFYKGSWQGKTFSADTESGKNVFGTEGQTLEEKYPFSTATGLGLRDKNLSVFKIDYKTGSNPFWISPVLDEIVEVAPGQYLGKIHYRLIPGFPFTLGYFNLEKSDGSHQEIRNITVKGKYFSLKLPQNWKVDFEDQKDLRLTELIALSPDFKGYSEKSSSTTSTPAIYNYFDSGAKLDILVEKGLIRFKEKIEGTILSTEEVVIAGIKTQLSTFTDPNTRAGEFFDAKISHEGNSYVFRMAYSPEKFQDAKGFFKEILASFKFSEEQK